MVDPIPAMLDAHKIKLKRLFDPETVRFKMPTMTKKAKATPSEKKMEDMVIREAVKFALQLALRGDRVNRRSAVPMQTRRNKMRIEDERRRKRRKMAGLPELPTGGVARIADIQKRDATEGFGSRTAGDRMFMRYNAPDASPTKYIPPSLRRSQGYTDTGTPFRSRRDPTGTPLYKPLPREGRGAPGSLPPGRSRMLGLRRIPSESTKSLSPEDSFWRSAWNEARGKPIEERTEQSLMDISGMNRWKANMSKPKNMQYLNPLREKMGLAAVPLPEPEKQDIKRWTLDAYDPLITVEGGKERFKFGTGPMEGREFRPGDIEASRTPAEHQEIVKNWMARPSEARAKLPDTFNIPGEGHMRGFDIRPKSPFQGMEIKRLPLPGQLQAEGKGGLTEYQKEIVTLKREERERETGLKRFESKAKAAFTKYLTPIKDELGADTEETGLPSEINQLYLDANSLAQQGKYKEADDFIKKGVAEYETERAETERIMNMPEEERKRYIEMRRKQLIRERDRIGGGVSGTF